MRLMCLSVRQPYASAILTGQKVEEHRSWRTNHRGPLAIHASNTLARVASFSDYPNFHPRRVKRGMLLGLVDVLDCVEMADLDEEGNYVTCFAWLLKSPRWLS